jgi:DNA-binding IclR family transcriptional regulator
MMNTKTGQPAKPPSPSVDRALSILHTLADQPDGMGVSELSRALHEAKSSLHAVLLTMELRGFLHKDPLTKRYKLGPQLLVIGAAYSRHTNLLSAFQAVAAQLVQRCGETVQLAMLHGRHILYIGKHEGTHQVRLAAQVGGQLPAHATALGKALLSGLDDAAIATLFEGVALEQLTSQTIGRLDELRRALAEVRAQGYAFDHGETNAELRCVAAPVYDVSGVISAAISVSVPITRMDAQREAELAELIRAHAQDLSRRLGYAGSAEDRRREGLAA